MRDIDQAFRIIFDPVKKFLVPVRVHMAETIAVQLVRKPTGAHNNNTHIIGIGLYGCAQCLSKFP